MPVDAPILAVSALGSCGALLLGIAAWKRSAALLVAAGFFVLGAAGFVLTTYILA